MGAASPGAAASPVGSGLVTPNAQGLPNPPWTPTPVDGTGTSPSTPHMPAWAQELQRVVCAPNADAVALQTASDKVQSIMDSRAAEMLAKGIFVQKADAEREAADAAAEDWRGQVLGGRTTEEDGLGGAGVRRGHRGESSGPTRPRRGGGCVVRLSAGARQRVVVRLAYG